MKSELQFLTRRTWPVRLTISLLIVPLLFVCAEASAKMKLSKASLKLEIGAAEQLGLETDRANGLHWESSNPRIAQVFQNGFVVGLMPGQSQVTVRKAGTDEAAECAVTVEAALPIVVNPETLRQYPNNREFVVDGRKCYGSELNGQRASSPAEKRFVSSNRVINPKPLRPDKPLAWEVQAGAEVYDGLGKLIGTIPPRLKVGDWLVPVSMFNYGTSKVIGGRLCLYAFAVPITPSPALAKSMDHTGRTDAIIETSAWLPLDRVVAREMLLERIGLGKTKPPVLPLEAKGYRVTGGNPKPYLTEFGEMSIVRHINPGSMPTPSHYLRRPSGTINLIYSVPGFGLGGQGTDSFLVSDDLEFFPAIGARVFRQPTYFPPKHPQAGKVSPQTMTFIYGAIKSKGFEPAYGWIAKEALADTPSE